MEAYRQVISQLPQPMQVRCAVLSPQIAATVTELRLRSGCPPIISCGRRHFFIAADGAAACSEQGLSVVTHTQLQECFFHLCHYSIFAYEAQLRRGFFTLRGGHRVGVASPAVWDGEKPGQPQSVTSLIIRIARTRPLVQPQRWVELLAKNDPPRLLVAGVPGSGKTTVLRALTGILSEMELDTAVLDERCELFPPEETGFGIRPPPHCDVLSGHPKRYAAEQALRTLAPQVLLCDELGGGDAEALLHGVDGGVGFIATVHAGSAAELRAKAAVRALTAAGAVRQAVVLDAECPGRIREVCCVD